MFVLSEKTKVSPLEMPSPKTPKLNNYVSKNNNIVRQLKYYIAIEAALGINRTYMFNNKLVLIISYLVSFSLITLTVLYLTRNDQFNPTYLVFKDTICIEYLLLTIGAIFQKKKLNNLFESLSIFDKRLNIEQDINITNPTNENLFWIIGSLVFFFLLEYLVLVLYVPDLRNALGNLIYIACLVHDCEIIFFCALLATISRRLHIIRAHVGKVFSMSLKGSSKSRIIKQLEALSENVNLDTSSLHQVYEQLHKCSEQLNSIMGFPLFVMLYTSGLATTLLLKFIIKLVQRDEYSPVVYSLMFYTIVRTVKYTFLMTFPCYYASVTSTQVVYIRTMLHDAIISLKCVLDKIERRKIKAFIQLTRDNDFAYVACGIIKLDMSFPLSYSSLCATYLVIIIQFSKFID